MKRQSRRSFVRHTVLGSMLIQLGWLSACKPEEPASAGESVAASGPGKPVVVATWNNDKAVAAGWAALAAGKKALDAVEAGARVPEADPNDRSVGYGGRPDRDGRVTLDACIMDEQGNAGSVVFLEQIKHPVSVARRVMEKTPHVMLAGAGAQQFAVQEGFPLEDLLTEQSRKDWEKWAEKAEYQPVINIENHDTIGILALDGAGNLSGACTTSGAAYKMRGRVGDSPIIGAGLFVDNEVGAAVATGLGELVMKTLGAFLVVEFMRNGMSPQEACEKAVLRIRDKVPDYEKNQVGYIALDKQGNIGAYAIQPGFSYAYHQEDDHGKVDSGSLL